MRNPAYKGNEPTELYVVWADGEWRTYALLGHAQRYYLKTISEGKKSRLIKYDGKTYLGSANQ